MWGTIPLPPDFCPTSQRNRAPHRTESCPTSNGITAPLAPEYARCHFFDEGSALKLPGFTAVIARMDIFSFTANVRLP
jgi:hypothetical protein